jgi:hypothetical protein
LAQIATKINTSLFLPLGLSDGKSFSGCSKATSCYVKRTSCYVKRTSFYVKRTSCYVKRTSCYVKRTSCYVKRTSCYVKRTSCYYMSANKLFQICSQADDKLQQFASKHKPQTFSRVCLRLKRGVYRWKLKCFTNHRSCDVSH